MGATPRPRPGCFARVSAGETPRGSVACPVGGVGPLRGSLALHRVRPPFPASAPDSA